MNILFEREPPFADVFQDDIKRFCGKIQVGTSELPENDEDQCDSYQTGIFNCGLDKISFEVENKSIFDCNLFKYLLISLIRDSK